MADDLERDVLPAQEAGFTGVYVGEDAGEGGENQSVATHRADFAVTSLREVPDLLG
ncbi:hypothetical protein [Halorussus caseinilyticus]|uniref:HAD family hydrolase n=1 Tax=Halorussus caseinilyticus TaxID=3034025 RepID=A0ABD5WKK2_9EURY